MKVLYEDNHLLVLDKPPNTPVQADASGDLDLLTAAKAYVKEKYAKPGEVYLGLVHRLDRPVGGVMVLARTGKAAARLTSQFKSRQVKKRYVAIVDFSHDRPTPPLRPISRQTLSTASSAHPIECASAPPSCLPKNLLANSALSGHVRSPVDGDPPAAAALTDWLQKDERTNTTSVVPEETGKKAELRFQTLARAGGQALLDVQPDTGRPHQIRVQLAHAGLPIHGDMRYHPQAKPGTQIRLWAYALTLRHPTLGEEMTFFSQPDWGKPPVKPPVKPPSPRGEAIADGRGEWAAQLTLLPAFSVCSGVYLDEELVVADKRSGAEVETDLVAQITPLLGEVYPVHRLDANTEGLVVLARTEQARQRLALAFREHKPRKLYHAIVCSLPQKKADRLVHYGVKDAENSLMRICEKDVPGAQRMALSYRVLENSGELAKLEITLETGRTHQIRAQMAAAGHPVLGDEKYGDFVMNKKYRVRRQQLLAKELEIEGRHFVSEKELDLMRNA